MFFQTAISECSFLAWLFEKMARGSFFRTSRQGLLYRDSFMHFFRQQVWLTHLQRLAGRTRPTRVALVHGRGQEGLFLQEAGPDCPTDRARDGGVGGLLLAASRRGRAASAAALSLWSRSNSMSSQEPKFGF